MPTRRSPHRRGAWAFAAAVAASSLAGCAEDRPTKPTEGREEAEASGVAAQEFLVGIYTADLSADDGAESNYFGGAVSLSGDTVLVGASGSQLPGGVDEGSAHVFVRRGAAWDEQAKLVASDAAINDFFGFSVALDGETAVVGARADDVGPTTNAGSAYVFVRSGDTWSEQAKLVAADPDADARLGWSIAVDGDTAIVGAPGSETDDLVGAGSAHVFVRNGDAWTEQARLAPSTPGAGAEFGWSVAIEGDTAIVGAPYESEAIESGGAAYVFVRNGETWTEQARIEASEPSEQARFGAAVALEGVTALVGAPLGLNALGAVHAFTRRGESWNEDAILMRENTAEGTTFGEAIALANGVAIVGAPRADPQGNGAAYIYRLNGAVWDRESTVERPASATGDFGGALALSSNVAIVGSSPESAFGDVGVAHVFVLEEMPDLPDGEVCELGETCDSGFCVAGVCCDTACVDDPPGCFVCRADFGASEDGVCTDLCGSSTSGDGSGGAAGGTGSNAAGSTTSAAATTSAATSAGSTGSAAPSTSASTSGAGGDGGGATGSGPGTDDGCGCRTAGGASESVGVPIASLAVLATVALARRRRRTALRPHVRV